MEIDALVQSKIDADTDFQATLTDLSDEDKEVALNEKRTELVNAEFARIEAEKVKADELAKNYKIRAEKAEKATPKKADAEPEPAKKSEEYSLQDIRALSDVHDDDVQEVVDFAKFKGISITEAKKNSTIQVLLKNKEEERKSDQAKHTGGGGKATSKTNDESLLNEAMEGKPPVDDAGIDRVVKARLEKKVNDIKNRTQ